MSDAALWALVLGTLGAVFGSHIAAVASRFPASATGGRSRCDACGRTLHPLELVPLVSWALLRGRCRTCRARIAVLHPAIESLGGAVGAVAGAVAPGPAGAAGAVLGWMLLALSAIDIVAWRLPHRLTTALVALGLLAGAAGLAPAVPDRAIGAVAGFGTLALIAVAYRAVRGRDGLGGGDPRLFAGVGAWLGWQALPSVLLVAALAGLALAAALRLRGGDRLPFGPLLSIGGFAAWVAYHWRA